MSQCGQRCQNVTWQLCGKWVFQMSLMLVLLNICSSDQWNLACSCVHQQSLPSLPAKVQRIKSVRRPLPLKTHVKHVHFQTNPSHVVGELCTYPRTCMKLILHWFVSFVVPTSCLLTNYITCPLGICLNILIIMFPKKMVSNQTWFWQFSSQWRWFMTQLIQLLVPR